MHALPALNQRLRADRLFNAQSIFLIGSIAIAVFPFLAIFFRRLWVSEHHQFFPMIVVAFFWLLYQRWPMEFLPLRFRDRLVATLALLGGMSSLFTAALLWSPWIAYVGTLLTILFLMIHFGGRSALPGLFSTWLLLWLLLPLPGGVDQRLVLWLQAVSSDSASKWLDALGYNHVLSGHVIHVPTQRFAVEEACSGTNSFFVLMSLTAILMVALRYPFFPALLLLISTIPWVIVANTIRIVLLVVLRVSGDIDLSTDPAHTVLGLATFAVAAGLLISTDRLILFLLAPTQLKPIENGTSSGKTTVESNELQTTSEFDDGQSSNPNSLDQRQRLLMGTIALSGISVGFLIIACVQLFFFFKAPNRVNLQAIFVGENTEELEQLGLAVDATAIQELPTGWEFIRFEKKLAPRRTGIRSVIWTYRRGDTTALISLDFPFRGWHELPVCYTVQGWEISSRQVMTGLDRDAGEDATLMVDLEKPTGEFGLVLVSLFDRRGDRLEPPPNLGWSWQRVTEDILNRLSRHGIEANQPQPVYQFQVFVESKSPLTSFERKAISTMYFAARKQLINRFTSIPHNP